MELLGLKSMSSMSQGRVKGRYKKIRELEVQVF